MNNELYHHGIRGQKWGRRRFQNSDGSLTELGRERYGRYENEKEKAIGASQYRKGDSQYLSNEEIKARIERIKLEEEYKKILPDERSKGQKFMQDVVTPAAMDYGKKQVGKVLDKAGDVAAEWATQQLSKKLGVDISGVVDSSKYAVEDMKKLTTKQLNERSERLEAENKYKKSLAGNFSNDNGKKKNKGGDGDDDNDNNNGGGKKNKGGSTVVNVYYDRPSDGGSNKQNQPKQSAPKKEFKVDDAPKQAPVKHVPTPENARMPSESVASVRAREQYSPYTNYGTNFGSSKGKYQYSAPPQKVDPRVFNNGVTEAKKFTKKDTAYLDRSERSVRYVENGRDIVRTWSSDSSGRDYMTEVKKRS